MTSNWPNKDTREFFEINEFIRYYKKLPHGRNFEIAERREKPDYILTDAASNERFGVELTSVYLSDRSVPDIHMKPVNGLVHIPYDPREIDQYKQRLTESVSEKIIKAEIGYDSTFPLILSVYVNENTSSHFEIEDCEILVKENEKVFDQMSPFCEVVFWPLPNETVFSVKPSRR